jgi:hypothetical protein
MKVVYVLMRVDTEGVYGEVLLGVYKSKKTAEREMNKLEARGDRDAHGVPYSYYVSEEEVYE